MGCWAAGRRDDVGDQAPFGGPGEEVADVVSAGVSRGKPPIDVVLVQIGESQPFAVEEAMQEIQDSLAGWEIPATRIGQVLARAATGFVDSDAWRTRLFRAARQSTEVLRRVAQRRPAGLTGLVNHLITWVRGVHLRS
jgi:hypothetical protein